MICDRDTLAYDGTESGWQERFLALLPAITEHLRRAFRNLNSDARAEAVQEGVASSLKAFRQLWLRGRLDLAYPTVLARFAARQIRAGRYTAERMNVHDLTSRYCQRRSGLKVERLDRFDADAGGWRQALVEDRTSGPADVAAARLDFAAFLQGLTRRERRLVLKLVRGKSVGAWAEWLGVTPGRVSQLRRKLAARWAAFQGDGAAKTASAN